MNITTRLTALLLLLGMVACGGSSDETASESIERQHEERVPTLLYGIDIEGYTIVNDTIRSGETVGGILGRRGISAATVDRLDKVARDIFPLRQIRADNAYTVFTRHEADSLGERDIVDYVVYHRNAIDYVVFGFRGDSVTVECGSRPITVERKCCRATINSSLWGTIMERDLPYALAAEFEDIYQWTVDFFGIQAGDSFAVIYDEKYVDGKSVGIGRIYGVLSNLLGGDGQIGAHGRRMDGAGDRAADNSFSCHMRSLLLKINDKSELTSSLINAICVPTSEN